ncbi:hypothetical protein V2J09_003557 [Rumex salicifolius]
MNQGNKWDPELSNSAFPIAPFYIPFQAQVEASGRAQLLLSTVSRASNKTLPFSFSRFSNQLIPLIPILRRPMAEVKTCGRPIDTLVERVLSMNILSSDYFKELYRLKTYHEVVDEIYNQVDHVEPWMTGNCRGPSTAFCLLYKFFTMKLTIKQMHGLLKHPDSPYIRAVGFLYLRYMADPKTLWSWCEPYIEDDEEFSPGSSGKMTTMGLYVRDLLLGQTVSADWKVLHNLLSFWSKYYFDTLFPRIPVPIVRQMVTNLEQMNLPTKHSGVTGDNNRIGSDDTARRPPSVKAALSVSFGQRAPHRASTRDSSPVRRAPLPPSYDRNAPEDSRHSPSRRRSQSRDRDSDRDRHRERDRERDRGRERDRERDYERERRHDYDRRRRSSDRESSRYRESSSRRSRSRSRSRSVQASGEQYERPSSQRVENKDRTSASANLAKLKDMYGDLGEKRDSGSERGSMRDSSTEEVIRLGGSSWK